MDARVQAGPRKMKDLFSPAREGLQNENKSEVNLKRSG
jgi:hypothetical protein